MRPSHTPGRFGVRAYKIFNDPPSPAVRSVSWGRLCAVRLGATHNRADAMIKENCTVCVDRTCPERPLIRARTPNSHEDAGVNENEINHCHAGVNNNEISHAMTTLPPR